MRVLSLDPAANLAGVACLSVNNGKIELEWTFVLRTVDVWPVDKKNAFISHSFACLVMAERPDHIVSEKPWGMGFAKESLSQLMGMLKTYHLPNFSWQTITQARKSVLGVGAANKLESALGLLDYPFTQKSLKKIQTLIKVSQESNSYDELDAILHGVAFLIQKGYINFKALKKE